MDAMPKMSRPSAEGSASREELGARLLDSLRPDEHLIWTGAPDPTLVFSKADLVPTILSVPFGAGLVYFLALAFVGAVGALKGGVTAPNPDAVGTAAILGFWCWGAWFVVFGRFFAKRKRKRRILYGLTDSRARLVATSGSRRLRRDHVDLSAVDRCVLIPGRRGTASVILSLRKKGFWRQAQGSSLVGEPRAWGFEPYWQRRRYEPFIFFDLRDADVLVDHLAALSALQVSTR
jgi:hypothetical protein